MTNSQTVDGAPSILTGTVAGQKFRGLVTFRPFLMGHAVAQAEVIDMTLRGIGERQVVVRVQESAPCYTMMHDVFVGEALETNPPQIYKNAGLAGPGGGGHDAPAAPPTERRTKPRTDLPFTGEPVIQTANHSYVGIVEAIGPGVRRVKVGDRVIVGPTPYCGVCYHCLDNSTEMCQIMFGQQNEWTTAIADTEDGKPVYPFLGIGGMSELTVAWEENVVPVYTDLSSRDLSLLGCQLASGLAVGLSRMQIHAGANVVIFGAGVVGASSILSAVACSAGQIIVVEPIAYRRELALKLGATAVLDPWAEGDNLLNRISELCAPRTSNRFAGGYPASFMSRAGADFAIDAVGAETYPVAEGIEKSPDPTGILPFQQTYGCTRIGGNVMWLGLADGDVAMSPQMLAMTGKIIWPGQQAGINFLRDIPRFISLMETGAINYKPIYDDNTVYGLDDSLEAIRKIGERSVLTTVVSMNQ